MPERIGDDRQKTAWQLARAMFTGYAARYPSEDFEIVELEKSFTGEIRNPDTGRLSQTFVMSGKADVIVKLADELYLLEHKTASPGAFDPVSGRLILATDRTLPTAEAFVEQFFHHPEGPM